jgi:putative ABC transport system permease protein
LVAVVNETLVNTFWKGVNPIGQRLRPCCGDEIPWFTVIGVAKDVKQGGVDQKTGTEFYFFVDQMAKAPAPLGRTPGTINVVLRTSLQPAALSQTVERLVHEMDPTVPVVQLRAMDSVFAESIRRPRLLAELLGVFAGLALLLAAIGVYGVLSYMVAQRHREIGIRLALGAQRRDVVGMVMRESMLLVVIGVIIGLGAALASTHLIASLLYGLAPNDPLTIALASLLLMTVAALAGYLPARRAARVDPMVALRHE